MNEITLKELNKLKKSELIEIVSDVRKENEGLKNLIIYVRSEVKELINIERSKSDFYFNHAFTNNGASLLFEYCSNCQEEVRILSNQASKCPNCDYRILPCSMCDNDKINWSLIVFIKKIEF